MIAIKEKLKDASLFRRIYIINLFFCNISFLQIPAYIFLVFLFIWGLKLVLSNQKSNNTFFKLRFGLWIGAFLVVTLISILFNFSVGLFNSVLMLLHVLICFFVFYGMHTEPDFNFRDELYFIIRFIVYATTIINILGIIFLLTGFRFEWQWIQFTIYENRFTGCYINPNLLGFSAVVSVICCHMLYKQDFISNVSSPPVNNIWIVACISTNLFSLVLCDSNASMVLILCYAVVYLTYMFFAERTGLTVSKVIIKIISLVLVSTLLVSSVLLFRTICQEGFSVVVSKTSSIISQITENFSGEDAGALSGDLNTQDDKNNNKTETITFSHQNKELDSGRKKLWKESVNLFKISPIIGISNGNIIVYSEEYFNGALSYSYHNSDLHNGFLTILVSTGIIGFLLFGIFGFRFAKHSAQHLFLQQKSYRNDVYPCLFAFLFAYLFYALFEKALLYDISFMVMWFWLMMGYMGCYIAGFEPMLETQYLFHRKRLTRTLL